MEKFGIFELLDTLSALTAKETPSHGEVAEGQPPAATDAAYAPPTYGTEQTPGGAPPRTDSEALSDFLARHDAIAKKFEKKR